MITNRVTVFNRCTPTKVVQKSPFISTIKKLFPTETEDSLHESIEGMCYNFLPHQTGFTKENSPLIFKVSSRFFCVEEIMNDTAYRYMYDKFYTNLKETFSLILSKPTSDEYSTYCYKEAYRLSRIKLIYSKSTYLKFVVREVIECFVYYKIQTCDTLGKACKLFETINEKHYTDELAMAALLAPNQNPSITFTALLLTIPSRKRFRVFTTNVILLGIGKVRNTIELEDFPKELLTPTIFSIILTTNPTPSNHFEVDPLPNMDIDDLISDWNYNSELSTITDNYYEWIHS